MALCSMGVKRMKYVVWVVAIWEFGERRMRCVGEVQPLATEGRNLVDYVSFMYITNVKEIY